MSIKNEDSFMDIENIRNNLENIGKEEFLDQHEKFKKTMQVLVQSQ